MKHVFIINPNAGKRDQTARIYHMADRLRDCHGLECACMLTDRPGGAVEMARRLAATGGARRFYACGGTGTGNDFLKNFGPDAAKFGDAENLWDGDVFPLDLIDCNGRLCLTIACNGIDARVADSVHQYSGLPLLSGRGSYLAAVAANVLLRPVSSHWTVWLDGERLEDDFLLVSMCNGRYYGGGSMPVPEARMDDGVLHTILVKKVGRSKFARLFSVYSAGNYHLLPPELVRVSTARTVRIQSEEELTTCLDGECFQSREVVLTLSDKRLNFFGPKGCSPNATAR